MGKDKYALVLWEEINNRLKQVQEGLAAMKDVPADIRQMKADLAEMKEWRGITEIVIKDQSLALNDYGARITKLETA